MFQSLTRKVLHPPAFGLDISDLSVKFAELTLSGNSYLPRFFGEVKVPDGVILSGEIKKSGELVAVLKDGLRDARGRKVTSRFCVASLPEEKSFVRVIELPPVKAEDLAKAVGWEIEGVIPLRHEDIFYDFEPIPTPAPLTSGPAANGEADRHLDVLITAFPKDIVESYNDVLRKAGFTAIALELESQAISRAIVPAELRNSPVIVVDIGATSTSFIMFALSSLIFTKTIAVGGRDFESAIAQALNAPLEEARKIKIAVGLDKEVKDGAVFEALKPRVEAITSELQREVWFYLDHPARRHKSLPDIERVILCGGDANLTGLARFVSVAVKRPVVVGDPLVNLKLKAGTIPPIPKHQSIKYTTAIGLAMRAAGM